MKRILCYSMFNVLIIATILAISTEYTAHEDSVKQAVIEAHKTGIPVDFNDIPAIPNPFVEVFLGLAVAWVVFIAFMIYWKPKTVME